jgi:uncharacterized protein YrrD
MLLLSNNFFNKDVFSLRTGSSVAKTTSAVINPDNLRIEGLYCSDRFSNKTLILLFQDIREFTPKGFFVNDHEVLSQPHELVRIQKILEINYTLIAKPVETISKSKVGKVSDYATDNASFYIQKLYLSQSILKSFSGGSLIVDRTQINSVTPKKIIINDLLEKARLSVSPSVV